MPSYKVTYTDYFKAESEEDAYDALREYLAECVKTGDVTAFDFEEGSPPNKTKKGGK